MALADGALVHHLSQQRYDYWVSMAVSLSALGMTLRLISSAALFSDTLKKKSTHMMITEA
jgi:hypothetical protein